jgi:hypothetical protein
VSLKLHALAPSCIGIIHHLKGLFEAPLMVNPDFRDYEGRVSVPD